LWQNGPNGIVDGTIWGYPYELVEVLPHVADDGNNKAFIIFGDAEYSYLIMKKGLQLTNLVEGTISGADGSTINLAEQDMTALRAVSRMNAKVHFPTAFSVIGTGTVS
jgi:HK97 family phage major capsid protein